MRDNRTPFYIYIYFFLEINIAKKYNSQVIMKNKPMQPRLNIISINQKVTKTITLLNL